MAFFGGGLYGLIGLVTFVLLVIRDWDACVGIGGCALTLLLDWLAGLFWPLYWLYVLFAG